jgi:hypothetical protein
MKTRPNQGLTINMSAGGGRVASIPGRKPTPWIWVWDAVNETTDLSILYTDDSGITETKVHNGIKLSIGDNRASCWTDFNDSQASNASGQLNWRDTAAGNFMHVFVNFSEAGAEIKGKVDEGLDDGGTGGNGDIHFYWFTDTLGSGWTGIGAYQKKISFGGDRHVFVFDMMHGPVAPGSPGGTFDEGATWNNIPEENREAPIKLEFYLEELTASVGRSYIIYGMFLASRIADKSEISIPLHLSKAWS